MTSTSVIEDSEEAIVGAKELEQVTYIQYLITFPDGVTQDGLTLDPVSALLDLGSEVNTMYPVFVEKLGLVVQIINIGAQKIDGTTFETYKIVVAAFLVTDQADKIRFFEETFLVANVNRNIVLEMSFLILSNVNVDFSKKEL